MDLSVAQLKDLPSGSFYTTDKNGQLVDDWSQLPDDSVLKVHIRLCGGKGGFGSLLRSFGSQFYKSTNQDACRDLSGRRIRDVNQEEKLKKWIGKQAERDEKKRKAKEDRMEKLQRTPRHEFKDDEYFKTKEEILEKSSEAVEEGIRQALIAAESEKSDAAGPSTSQSSSTVAQSGKRKTTEPTAAGPTLKKSKMLWTGCDDLDISDDNSEDDEETTVPSTKKSIQQ